jgi:hypothetical protein
MNQGQPKMINILGTIIFATIIGIGWLDSRGSLNPFGKYTSLSVARLRPRPSAADPRGGEDQAQPPAPAL